MEIADTFELLVGRWTVRRTISDHRTGVRGSFDGTAELARSGRDGAPDAARYREVGVLRYGAYEGTAGRQLGYRRREDGSVLVTFPDGRTFVDCDPRGGSWHAEHRCGEDRYELAFAVRSPDVLDERWRVRGPAKDYDAWTTLSRWTPAAIGPQRQPR